jgi:hypothetical protein
MIDPQTIAKIGKALLSAQIEIQKTEVEKAGTNPHFKNTYAELPDVIDVVIPILNKNGIVVIQLPTESQFPNVLAMTTLLLHAESGESISGTAILPLGKEDPQGYGGALTYARRYALMSALGLKAADDDGETAVGRGNLPKTEGTPRPKPSFLGGGKKDEEKPAPTAKAPQRAKGSIFPKVGRNAEPEGGEDNGETERY